MSAQYDDMQGAAQDVQDHPAYNKPDATQHYAGDVIPLSNVANDNYDPRATDYALGKKTDPKVVSIPAQTLQSWATRTSKRIK